MIRRPPRSTRMTHCFPTRLSSDLPCGCWRVTWSGARGRLLNGSCVGKAGIWRGEAGAYQDGRPVGRPGGVGHAHLSFRSEEHTSELQSLMRRSYAAFCLKKQKRLNSTRLNLKLLNNTPILM